MNARIERKMNSENLGARIMENGALEAYRGKTVFSRGYEVILEFCGLVGGSWHKIQGLL
jgi:hypothetical protein